MKTIPAWHLILGIVCSLVVCGSCNKGNDGHDPPVSHWYATDTVVISWMNPGCAAGGEPFIVRGSHFDETSKVFFVGHEAEITARTPYYITGIIPLTAQVGSDYEALVVVTNAVASDSTFQSMLAVLPPQPVGSPMWYVGDTARPIYQPDIEAFWTNAYDTSHQFFFDVDSGSIFNNGSNGTFEVQEYHFGDPSSPLTNYLNGNEDNGDNCSWSGGFMMFNVVRSDGLHWIQCYRDTSAVNANGVPCARMLCWDLGACGQQFILGCP